MQRGAYKPRTKPNKSRKTNPFDERKRRVKVTENEPMDLLGYRVEIKDRSGLGGTVGYELVGEKTARYALRRDMDRPWFMLVERAETGRPVNIGGSSVFLDAEGSIWASSKREMNKNQDALALRGIFVYLEGKREVNLD